VARESADAAKGDAVIVNGDLAINGPDREVEIVAATALGYLHTRVMACLATTTWAASHPARILTRSSMQIGSQDGTALLPPIDGPWMREAGAWSASTRSISARAWCGNTHRISGSTR